MGGLAVDFAGDGDGAEVEELFFELEDGELGVELFADMVVEGEGPGNSSRKVFNLREIGERAEGFGWGAVVVGDEATVGLEEAELAEGGVIGPFPALVVAVDLFEMGFVLLGGLEGAEDGFLLLAFLHLPGGGD